MPQIMTPLGVSLEYETFGHAEDPPLLMVMGFATQLIGWPRGLCERLAAGGRRVIAFDNRDCGLSAKFDGREVAVDRVMLAASSGDFELARRLAPYTLSDMSDDAFGLLTALGVDRAHILGASMGGMIAQTMAIEHPERVLTLTSMMSGTGEPEYGQSEPAALEALLAPPAVDRDGYIASAETWMTWHSKRYPELELAQALAAESYDRCHHPPGSSRQLAAMIASGPRADALRELRTPTLVIHGRDDTLITPSGGERTAALIPGAELLMVDDMGHDRPEALWPLLCDAVLEHTDSPRLQAGGLLL